MQWVYLPRSFVKEGKKRLRNKNAEHILIDITDENQMEEKTKYIINKYKKIDILINNAAIDYKPKKKLRSSSFEKTTLENWIYEINVGLTGAFICSKLISKYMIKRRSGIILNISSDLSIIAPDQRLYHKENLSKDRQLVKPVSYSVIKTGLIGLTRYLATYWIDQGVRCNAICPGGVDSGQPKEFLAEVSSRIPMNRLANADEYQGTLVWMLSEASSYLNGAIVPVDGGRTAW